MEYLNLIDFKNNNLYCTDVLCDKHKTYIYDLCNSIIDSCTNAANVTIPSCKPKSVAREVPDGQMRLSLNITSHFSGIGPDMPQSGFVYDSMKRTRHRYHYAIRSRKKRIIIIKKEN